MPRLEQSIEEYLKRIEWFDGTLGPAEELPVAPVENQLLMQTLQQHLKSANSLISLALLLLCLAFGSIFFLVVTRLEAPLTWPVLGGASALALGTVKWLQSLWRERVLLAISLTLLDKLPPERAADCLLILYWGFLRQPQRLSEKLSETSLGLGSALPSVNKRVSKRKDKKKAE